MLLSKILDGLKKLDGEKDVVLQGVEELLKTQGDTDVLIELDDADIEKIAAEKLKNFLVSNKEGERIFNSLYDVRFNKYVEEKLPERLKQYHQTEMEKLSPKPDNPKDKELKELKERLDASDKREKRAALKELAVKYADKEGIPLGVAIKLLGEDEETTLSNLRESTEELLEWHNKRLQKNTSGIRQDTGRGSSFSKADLEKMTEKELVEYAEKHPEEVDKIINEE